MSIEEGDADSHESTFPDKCPQYPSHTQRGALSCRSRSAMALAWRPLLSLRRPTAPLEAHSVDRSQDPRAPGAREVRCHQRVHLLEVGPDPMGAPGVSKDHEVVRARGGLAGVGGRHDHRTRATQHHLHHRRYHHGHLGGVGVPLRRRRRRTRGCHGQGHLRPAPARAKRTRWGELGCRRCADGRQRTGNTACREDRGRHDGHRGHALGQSGALVRCSSAASLWVLALCARVARHTSMVRTGEGPDERPRPSDPGVKRPNCWDPEAGDRTNRAHWP